MNGHHTMRVRGHTWAIENLLQQMRNRGEREMGHRQDLPSLEEGHPFS